ncbi:MAG TPA: alpha/beta hydrolase [Pedomonas sp.]|uniref:alpha/beta hydrolase n=1 Tax=Pedomonas sp. TaxID=2976421 RepID=UPI002F410C2D
MQNASTGYGPAFGPVFGRRSFAQQTRLRDWRAPDGWPLRTLCCLPEGDARGTVLFLNGRGDFIEKYLESYGAFLDWGYAVATLDWRGQGLSGRLGDHPHKGHQTDFDILVSDLAHWIEDVARDFPPPFYLVAHSMGGHLALRYLAEHNGSASGAVLLAPMLGIRTGGIPSPVTKRLARWMVSRGRAGEFAPTQRPHGAWQSSALRQGALTADNERFADEVWWTQQNPALALGGVTYGWLDAAFRSLDRLHVPGYLQRVKTPVLILLPELEQVVDPVAARHVAAHLPQCRLEVVPGGRHELLRDADTVRLATLAHIRAALEGAAHG